LLLFSITSLKVKSEDEKIEIGEDMWLWALVVVLNGVKIGKESVVGAGSVVTKNIPEYLIAVGVPDKVIERSKY